MYTMRGGGRPLTRGQGDQRPRIPPTWSGVYLVPTGSVGVPTPESRNGFVPDCLKRNSRFAFGTPGAHVHVRSPPSRGPLERATPQSESDTLVVFRTLGYKPWGPPRSTPPPSRAEGQGWPKAQNPAHLLWGIPWAFWGFPNWSRLLGLFHKVLGTHGSTS